MNNLKLFLQKIMGMDKKKKAYIIAGLAIVFVMVWAFVSAGVITSNFNRNLVKTGADSQKVDALSLIITETKEGSKYFEIYGESGNYSNDHSIATLNNVVGNFYKDGEVAMSFQSTKGEYNEKERTITLYNHTYIVLKDETSLETDKLTWYGSDKETVAEGNVKIKKSKEMIATADKCVIGVGYENFKIIGKTQTKIFQSK